MLPQICPTASRLSVTDYLARFWDGESPYFKEQAGIWGKPVSHKYIKQAQDVIRLYVVTYKPFGYTRMDGLTATALRDYMRWLSERGLSGSRINRVLQALRVPFRYALSRDEAQHDPFIKVKPAAYTSREKGALTKEEAAALIEAPVTDNKSRLIALLGLLSGLRIGEVRGLCWEDADETAGVIHIKHNWQDIDGLKGPKCGSAGDVPFPRQTREVFEAYRAETGNPTEGLVFARKKDGKPYSNSHFGILFAKELEAATGIKGQWRSRKKEPEGWVNEQAARNLTFHSLRHTFVSMARLAGINDFEAQAMARHKSSAMMDRYSHARQVVDIKKCRGRLEDFYGQGSQ
jgi:integrase